MISFYFIFIEFHGFRNLIELVMWNVYRWLDEQKKLAGVSSESPV